MADPPQSDDELARRNEAQLAAFVGYVAPDIRPTDREDIAQETWVRALAHRESMPNDPGEEGKWLRAVSRNLVRDRWRRSERDRVRQPRLAGATVRSEPGADEPVLASLESTAVRAAFDRLRPLQRQILELRILEGRTAVQTAEVVGRRPDDVRQIQYRAIAILRRQLAAAGWLDEGDAR